MGRPRGAPHAHGHFYENADVLIMGRKHYQGAARYFPGAGDHPCAAVINAARKVVFSHTIRTADWANTSIASGDLGAEIEKLKLDGDGYIIADGGAGFFRSLIRRDLIDEYRVRLVPYLAGKGTRLFSDLERPARLEFISATPDSSGTTELAFRRISRTPANDFQPEERLATDSGSDFRS
jgi:dihydrofolate reductase